MLHGLGHYGTLGEPEKSKKPGSQDPSQALFSLDSLLDKGNSVPLPFDFSAFCLLNTAQNNRDYIPWPKLTTQTISYYILNVKTGV